jgi:mannosyltransferase OCH1-like enzyme
MIPNLVFQIAIGEQYLKNIPQDKIKNNIIELNPGFAYQFYTEADCLNFLNNFYPKYKPMYGAINRPQFKSDLMRCLLLHKFGGVYVDIDLLPIVSFHSFNTNWKAFFTIGAHHDGLVELANGFMGSVENNSFFIDVVEDMSHNYNDIDYGANIKRMYRILKDKHGVEKFTTRDDVYFFQEQKLSSGVYVIKDDSRVVCISNGSGYPHCDVNKKDFEN